MAKLPGSTLILDASSLDAYRTGHVPGAVHTWWQDTMDPNGAVYGMVLKPDENAAEPQRLRREYLEDLGVTPDRPVVVYDDAAGRHAARIVWTLRFLGHENVALLYGGLPAWVGAGGEIARDTPEAEPARGVVVDPRQGYYIWTSDLVEALTDARTALVDIRTDGEREDTFGGTVNQGAIAGSISIPWDELVNPATGELNGLSVIRERFVSAGVTADRRVILYGNFGSDAALPWLILKLLGYTEVLIYDGGWAEWSESPPI
jgi:thiosulfate/3-mercaptopyruvate sulfurtransferase